MKVTTRHAERILVVALGACVLILLGAGVSMWMSLDDLTDSTSREARAQKTIDAARELRLELMRTDMALQGAGRPQPLSEPPSAEKVSRLIGQLREGLSEDAEQGALLKDIAPKILEWANETNKRGTKRDRTISMFPGARAELVRLAAFLTNLEHVKQEAVAAGRIAERERANRTRASILSLLLAGGGVAVFAFLALHRDFERIRSQEGLLAMARSNLEELVNERTKELSEAHENERLVSNMIRRMTEVCFFVHADWTIGFANDRVESLLGRKPEELKGKRIWEVFPHLVGTSVQEAYERAMKDRVPVLLEAFSPLAGRWLEIRLFPTGDGLSAFLLDIDGRKKSELALQEREVLLQETGRIAKVGGWSIGIGQGERFWTEQVLRIFDLDPALGQIPGIETLLPYYTEGSRERALAAVRDAIEVGKPFDLELDIVSAAGLSKRIRVIGQSDLADGRVVKVHGSLQDVTEHYRMKARLEHSEARLVGIIDSAMDAIVIVNSNHKIQRFNAAAEKMFGIPASEAIGSDLSTLIPERFRQGHLEKMIAFGETLEPHRYMGGGRFITGLRADGSEFPIETSISYVDVLGERLFTAVVRDVTERVRAEETLRKQHEQFLALIEQAPVDIAMFDRNMCYLAASRRWIQDYGRGRDQLLGLCHYDIHPDLPEEWKSVHVRGMAGEYISKSEDMWVQEDGSKHWLRWAVHPWHDTSGDVGGVIMSAEDITDRKLAEESLKESERRFSAAFLSSPVALLIFRRRDLAVLEANEPFLRLFQLARERVLASSVDKLGVIEERVVNELDKQLTERGKVECEVAARTGTGALLEVFLSIGEIDISGEKCAIVTVTDITGRKLAELALADRDRQLRESQTVGAIGSWETELVTGQTRWSDELFRLLRIPPESTPSLDLYLNHVLEDDREKLRHAAMRARTTGEPYHMDHHVVREDGLPRWFQIRGETIRDASGRFLRIRGTVQDITDRIELEAQLQQAQKMEAMGRLAGGVAHDFNNLLTVIMGHAGILEMPGDPAHNAHSVEAIKLACERASNLTRQLLLFARKQTMQLRRLDLAKTVHQTAGMLSRILGEDIHLEIKTPEPIFIDGDPGMIDQVLVNLAVNSRDAMDHGGNLWIKTEPVEFDAVSASLVQLQPGRYACLSVADSGSGIKADVLPKIFDPFFTTKDAGKGTGLGLSTVFAIVQQHGGIIKVYSEERHGTIFRVYIPLAAAPGQTGELPTTPMEVSSGTETILLAEDERVIREMLQQYLTRLGYHVIAAASGPAAIEEWSAHKDSIALLLTDMVMPDGMSGVQLAETLAGERPDLPVVYMSGYSDFLGAKALDLREGINFLPKPFALASAGRIVRSRLDAAADGANPRSG